MRTLLIALVLAVGVLSGCCSCPPCGEPVVRLEPWPWQGEVKVFNCPGHPECPDAEEVWAEETEFETWLAESLQRSREQFEREHAEEIRALIPSDEEIERLKP